MSASDDTPRLYRVTRGGSTISEAQIHAELLRIVANALALPHSEGVAYLGRVADALEQIK